jgi:hypothetical protein
MAENVELAYLVLVSSLNTNSQTVFSPIEGIINKITVTWPSGCNFLVEVLFRHKRVQFIPTPAQGGSVGIALNNFTETLNPNWAIAKDDPVELYAINHDGVNNHSISAVVHITGYETSESSGERIRKEAKCIRRT